MPVNNPGGANGTSMFEGFSDETAYGAVKRLKQNTSAAPMPVHPALGAPDRARKRKGQPQGQPQVPVVQQLAEAPPPPSSVWAEVAGIPGINIELVQAWAGDA